MLCSIQRSRPFYNTKLEALSESFMILCTLNYLITGFAFESHVGQLLFSRLQNGCDVNSQSYSGNTPLHNACGRGQVDTVRLLLKSGADSTLKNYHNDTPMMVAKNKKVSHGDGAKTLKLTKSQLLMTNSFLFTITSELGKKNCRTPILTGTRCFSRHSLTLIIWCKITSMSFQSEVL